MSVVCNKMALDPISDELKLKKKKKIEKTFISKEILFKKIAIMHGKGEFSNIKGSFCNMTIGTANI